MPLTKVFDDLLAAFDHSVSGVHLLDGPRPSYELYDAAEWHTRGISQGLKIARTILEENMKLASAGAPLVEDSACCVPPSAATTDGNATDRSSSGASLGRGLAPEGAELAPPDRCLSIVDGGERGLLQCRWLRGHDGTDHAWGAFRWREGELFFGKRVAALPRSPAPNSEPK